MVSGALVVLMACSSAIAFVQGERAKSELELALPLVKTLQQQLLIGDFDHAAATVEELSQNTQAAEVETSTGVWPMLEVLPFVGENFRAAAVVSEAANDLVNEVLKPLSTIDLAAFVPHDGALDVDAVAGLTSITHQALKSVDAAMTSVGSLHKAALLSQVRDKVDDFEDVLAQGRKVLDGLDTVLGVAPGLLGADGPRNYLLLFQNNAESRGTGGNPASIMLLHVDDGRLDIQDQVSSINFDNVGTEHRASVDDQTLDLYGAKIVRFMQDMTLTPDFPTTAMIAQAWWAYRGSSKIDGVISIDPVALSYLLRATGAIALETGDTLTADNAVSLLLNEVYFRYPVNAVQDAFFASAARAAFEALTRGDFDLRALWDALVSAADEGRLLFWSVNPDEADLIADSRVSGELPSNDDDRYVTGVYFNDTTGSKLDYYVDTSITMSRSCAVASDTSSATITFANTVPPTDVDSLSPTIQGIYYHHGRVATDVVIYAPHGETVTNLAVNGEERSPNYAGTHLGRSVIKVSVTTDPGTATEITYDLTGRRASPKHPLEVWHTPMARDTHVEVSTEQSCLD